MNKTRINSWLTIATSHKYFNKSYIIQSTHIVRLWTKPKEKKTTQLLDPRLSQLGSTTDQHEMKHSSDQDLHWAPIWARLHHLHWYRRHLQLFWKYLWVTRTQQSQNPRDQDYLSLWVGKGNEVELQQALSKYGGKHTQIRARREQEERSWS